MKINDDYSFFFWILVLIITLKIIWSLLSNDHNSLLWFCFINMCILTVGLYFKNDFVIGSILVSSLLISTLIGFDIIGFTFWGELIFGVYPRIFEMDVFDSILTYYHFLLILIPLYILCKKRFIHPQSWVLSSVFFLIILFTSSVLSDSNLNCSTSLCDLGFLSSAYHVKPLIMPFFIFHWISMTFLVFIPTNFLCYFLINQEKQ